MPASIPRLHHAAKTATEELCQCARCNSGTRVERAPPHVGDAAQGNLRKEIAGELEWLNQNAKGQQKKGKARLRRYDDLVEQVPLPPPPHMPGGIVVARPGCQLASCRHLDRPLRGPHWSLFAP